MLPLRELEEAIGRRDVPVICRSLGRLVSVMGTIYATPAVVGRDGHRRTDPGRGDRLIEVERCIDGLRSMPVASGLAGVVWDQGWAVAALQYLAALLRGRPALDPVPTS